MISVDAIFFDVDGTLVDARKDIANAVNHALVQLGVKKRPEEEIVSYIGTGVSDLITRSLGPDNSGLIETAVKAFSDYYVDHSIDEAKLYPHTKEVLEHFKDKRKFILTNRYSRFAEIALKGLGIRQYFECIIGGDDENCLKPSACVMDLWLPKLKVFKDRSIIVGDMAIDVLMGKNAGIKTCWVDYGLGKFEDLKGVRPDYTISDLLELEKIIK